MTFISFITVQNLIINNFNRETKLLTTLRITAYQLKRRLISSRYDCTIRNENTAQVRVSCQCKLHVIQMKISISFIAKTYSLTFQNFKVIPFVLGRKISQRVTDRKIYLKRVMQNKVPGSFIKFKK